MSKYIPAEKLKAEIEFAKSVYDNPKRVIHGVADAFRQDGRAAMCDDILKKIASLQQEQPEVVLTDDASFTKELKRFLSDTGNEKKRGGVILPIIKHFYSLWLNARKK